MQRCFVLRVTIPFFVLSNPKVDSSVPPKLIIDDLHSPKRDTLAIGLKKERKIEKKIFDFYFMVCNSKECHILEKERERRKKKQQKE